MEYDLPLVSVIIPVLNGEKRIKRCLESIENQTYPNIEVLIIDANSADNTVEIAKEYGEVFSFDLKPFMVWGTPYQQNFGATKAKGKYLYFVDDDMILPPDAIQSFVDKIEAHGGDSMIIPEISIGEGFWAKCKILERSCYLLGDTSIEAPRFHRKSVWDELGGLDPRMGGHYDWDIHIKLRKNGYKVIRAEDAIYHDEGKLTLRRLVKKKYLYGKTAKIYLMKYRKNKEVYKDQFNLIRPIYLRNWRQLIKDPFHSAGFACMKTLETTAFFAGFLRSNPLSLLQGE